MVVETTSGGGLIPQNLGSGTNLVSGRNAVAAAGTAELLITAGTVTKQIIIKAYLSNGGYIYVGNDGTAAGVTSTTGITLAAGDAIVLDIDHSQKPVYIDSSVNAEGVEYIYIS